MNSTDAEAACIAALLLQPAQIPVVAAWLDHTDFAHPGAASTYQLMTELWSHGSPVGPTELLEPARADAAHHGVAAPYIAELLDGAREAGHAVGYARIVVEAAAQRRLGEHAADIVTDRLLTESGPHRQPTLAESLHSTNQTGPAVDRAPDNSESADRAYAGQNLTRELANLTDLPHGAELESDVIRALASNPKAVLQVRRWLSANDFADDQHAATYRMLIGEAPRGPHTEPVTERWNHLDERAAAAAVPEVLATDRPAHTYAHAVRLGAQLLSTSVAARTATAAESLVRPAPSRRPTMPRRHAARYQLDPRPDTASRWLKTQVEP